ncbi:cGMP-dependent 3',5'-cyclic phosphodiesterase-like [Neocloeon triangulifer]|uniref:cGMP-dependent 3',5'-cyclic phosphodiesterase-like n=1 Tax=Neocloeon triangulifer TaxID=2078957 RepID=UPI00286ED801|nr:cGMP-dependent 3',5'-cyclic phosphodiesterase-like [Neocloeon triangulifer]XP_059476033.1 cGMP-dependent 3',5'-cyclic phosphodiesterase-like [Neocloeon triangulifer]
MSRPQRLLRLCASLHDQNSAQLQVKINNFLQEESGSKCVFLVPILAESEEVLVQVIMEKILPQEMRFPMSTSVLGMAITSSPITLTDLPEEKVSELSHLLGFDPESYLSVCIRHPESQSASLIVCLVNFPPTSQPDKLIDIAENCCLTLLGIILNTMSYEREKRLKMQCQSLLTVAKNLFTHLDNINELLREIMMEAQKLTNAERCSLFLLDHEHHQLVANVFDGYPTKGENEPLQEIRIAENQGIAGHVAMTGELLNIKDAYSHPLFYKGMDETTGFVTRNILCIPIKDEKRVVGVAQLCNKINGMQFTSSDEEIAVAFSIFCGISIMHSLMYKKVQDAQSRSKLSNELMMYHMKVSADELSRLAEAMVPSLDENFSSYYYVPRDIPVDNTPSIVLAMFEDLGLSQRWRIGQEVLAKFVLLVKRGYRDPPYHNWMHAFTVTHFAFLLLKNLKVVEQGHISELEALALIVSCLCHDLDHRGTTNSFQLTSNSVLAGLYSSEGSVMERHHLSQTMCILNTEGCNILQNLNEKEYEKVLELIREIILATDLAQHLRIVAKYCDLVSAGFDKTNETHRKLLLTLMMTCCDLSDQTKKWPVTKRIAVLVYQEFFSQGDLEKAMGNRPIEMMDREKACIPTLQLQFLDDIVLPTYNVLCSLFDEAKPLLEILKFNCACWKKALEIYTSRWPQGGASINILEDESLEKEVMDSLECDF